MRSLTVIGISMAGSTEPLASSVSRSLRLTCDVVIDMPGAAWVRRRSKGGRIRDHSGFVNAGVRRQHLLYVERRNVFSTAHDNVLLAIHDQDVPVLRDHCHVSSVKPSAAQSLGRGFRLLPVPSHHPVTAGNDF